MCIRDSVNTVYALFYKEDPIEPGNAGKKEIPKTYRMISVDEAGLFGTVIPVSYTHLDVYKRQDQ